MSPSPQLRQAAFLASVVHEVDLVPDDDGPILLGPPDVQVTWEQCAAAIEPLAADTSAGVARLARWLHARRQVADLPDDWLVEMARPVGLPHGHVLHPGPDWVVRRVLGDALDLGIGLLGLDSRSPETVVVVPAGVWLAAGHDVSGWWATCESKLERMGELAARRWHLDPDGRLRPMGDCDVVTLLGSSSLRHELAGSDGGMRAVLAPMRTRGWTKLASIDPAFGPAAAAATDATDRGFVRPLLVTADEVVMVPQGGRPAVVSLADPTPRARWDRDVFFR